MGRFEMALDLELDKYRRMEPPVAPPSRQAVVAIDCLATCCCGAHFVLPRTTALVHCVRSAAHLGSLSRSVPRRGECSATRCCGELCNHAYVMVQGCGIRYRFRRTTRRASWT